MIRADHCGRCKEFRRIPVKISHIMRDIAGDRTIGQERIIGIIVTSRLTFSHSAVRPVSRPTSGKFLATASTTLHHSELLTPGSREWLQRPPRASGRRRAACLHGSRHA
ncbi:hypothetical protein HN011_009086 [Eciton burchellii]|nr:hypothetical protein HN011_009086 [Eciton burchellii]